jgi:hypothetical protein
VFLKEVNRPSPEAERNLHLVYRLRTREGGAVPKPPILLDSVVFSKHKNNFTFTFCATVPNNLENSMESIWLCYINFLIFISLHFLLFCFNAIYLSALSLSPFFRWSPLPENILNSHTKYSPTCCSIRIILFLDWTDRKLIWVSKQDRQNTYNFTRTQPLFGLPGVSGWSLTSCENSSAPSAVYITLIETNFLVF